jgi:hypothetical protein
MAISSRRARSGRAPARSGAWVRKNMLMDQRKLDAVRRALNVTTETEAVDAALDEIAFRGELARGIRALRRAGGVVGLYER